MSSLSSRSSELPLESLYLSKIGSGDRGLGWLWKNCSKLKKLGLRSCEGIGDDNSFTSFINCLKGLKELELRTCRTIVDGILLQLAKHCRSLNSLLLYDGGSRESLYQFFNQSESPLQKLDLRLPLDLGNNHLSAVAENFRGLVSLRLQSCCLVTGEGLKTIGSKMSIALEELALINCDVVEREPGLLTSLGQNLKGLKKLDLSYNEILVDKEFVSMLISCQNLVDIRLRGCKKLTHFAVVSMSKCCKFLESVDIMHCTTIEAESVELFILSSMKLRRVQVEERKLTDVAKKWASQKCIEIIT
ncbi:Rni-like superfamily protein [Thalictrum thalictroides]|uniref:Rni-like superfamily protein n=1 Tax=Thalictrum thalictroides TaxID=46969 RepID=A0A7J6UT24_THATH|nr:Rni-like superfamily protein [Thalictrum thalictroides]